LYAGTGELRRASLTQLLLGIGCGGFWGNQTLVTSVDATALSRFNTVFAAHIWGGNALGAFLATAALTRAGRLAVCALAFASATLALLLQWLSVRRDRKQHDVRR